jgi:hypothetical protein
MAAGETAVVARPYGSQRRASNRGLLPRWLGALLRAGAVGFPARAAMDGTVRRHRLATATGDQHLG